MNFNFGNLSPGRAVMSPSFGQRGNAFGADTETDNIFNRIIKADFDNANQGDMGFGEDSSQRLPYPSGSSRFSFNNGGNAQLSMNQGPITPQDVVAKLNDDPSLMKALITGEGFSPDDAYRTFSSFTNETFNAALAEIIQQMYRLSIIDSLCSSMGQLQDVESSLSELESTLSEAFNDREVIIWYNVPTAQVLYSPTNKARVTPNVGIIGNAANHGKRRTISNPKTSGWYKE